MTLLPTTLVGSYPQPDWLIDRNQLQSNTPPRVRRMALSQVFVESYQKPSPSFSCSVVKFGVALGVLTSLSVVGLPSQFSLFNTTVPISLGMGVPMELLPLIVAVEVVPDIFRTIGNVTADVAVTTVAARSAEP